MVKHESKWLKFRACDVKFFPFLNLCELGTLILSLNEVLTKRMNFKSSSCD